MRLPQSWMRRPPAGPASRAARRAQAPPPSQHANAAAPASTSFPPTTTAADVDAREAARAAVREELAAATGDGARALAARRGRRRRASADQPRQDRGRNRGRRGGERPDRARRRRRTEGRRAPGPPERPGRRTRPGGGDGARKVDEQQADPSSASPTATQGKSPGRRRAPQQGQAQGRDAASSSSTARAAAATATATASVAAVRPGGDELEPEIDEDDVLIPVAGILDVLDNYAFVRTSGYLPGPSDVYVSLGQVKKYGPAQGRRRRRRRSASRARASRQQPPEVQRARPGRLRQRPVARRGARARVEFQKLTPLYPQERLRLETEPTKLTPRVIDLVAPIGKGQRGLIVSPPKAGKTIVLQQIANAIADRTTPRSTSWSCSSTSAPKRSPTCSAR